MPSPKLSNIASVTNILFVSFIVGCATTDNIKTDNRVEPTTQVEVGAEEQDILVNQQLSAIEAFIAQHQTDEALIILNSLNFNGMTTEQKTRYLIAQTDTALILGEGQQALEWISGEHAYLFSGLPIEQQLEIGLKRAEAYEYAGKPLSAARERIYLAPVLDQDTMLFNHEQIWFDLQLVTEERLRALAEQESSPDLTGWIELSLISLTQSDDLYRLLTSIEKWQKQNRAHPASKLLPGSLQMLSELASAQPKHIGVLLPLSGTLANVGNAVRNGLLTSWYQARENNQETPELTFYDTAGAEDIQNLYRQAITNGAESIIGPLSKAKVQRLSEMEEVTVPILALNYTDFQTNKKPNLYQFGLSPKDEAVQIANDIWQQGIRSVLVIAPDTKLGHRISDDFIKAWQLKGGSITSKALFTKPDKYLGTIKNALNIQNSETRRANLQRRLDVDIEFEFRRRQDIDMVFMVAYPAQARQLKPILNYQRATEIPIVATSYMYSGRSNADLDKDLEGIEFVEIPWRLSPNFLKTQATEAFPKSINNYDLFVALGVDAFRLYPRLAQMSTFSDVRIQGVTGAMTMNPLGRIERKLDWAVIENGLAKIREIEFMPELP
jgi:outer membrane PBP1 activator LpoA protein